MPEVRETDEINKKKMEEGQTSKWRFVVLGAAFIILIIVKFSITTFGVMYLRLLSSSTVSSTTVAWIFNLGQCGYDISAVFAGALCDHFGWRRVTFLSGLIFGLATASSGFFENPMFLLLTYSALTGLSCGTCFAVCNFIVPAYFVKGRGVAMGILYAGYSLGDFLTPPIVYFLQQTYGERSALFVIGALTFNICLASMVFHPVEWHKDLKESSRTKVVSTQDSSNMITTLTNIFKSLLTNLKMLKNLRVMIIAFSSGMILVSEINLLLLIPFSLESRGIPLGQITMFLSVMGVANIVTCILVTTLTDILKFSAKWYLKAGFLISAAVSIGYGYGKTTFLIYTFMVLFGVSLGICFPILPLVMIEFMGLDQLHGTFAVAGFANVISFLFIGPLIGVIRDATGDYEFVIQLLSIPLLLALLAFSFMPLAASYDKKKSEKAKQQRMGTLL